MTHLSFSSSQQRRLRADLSTRIFRIDRIASRVLKCCHLYSYTYILTYGVLAYLEFEPLEPSLNVGKIRGDFYPQFTSELTTRRLEERP